MTENLFCSLNLSLCSNQQLSSEKRPIFSGYSDFYHFLGGGQVLKNGLVPQKNRNYSYILLWGSDPEVIKITFLSIPYFHYSARKKIKDLKEVS